MSEMNITAEAGKPFICTTRVFNAPRELVFEALTNPKHIPNWWGPRYLTTEIDRLELRPGGLWRFVQRDQQGNVHAFHGVYHDITAPERTVSTFEYEGVPGHVVLETTQLEALPEGKTRLTTTSVFQSVEDRDGMVASGMEGGLRESWDRLEELLGTFAKETR
jgi:uncharacterized protein YndB with AHSA1/START domain